MIVCSPTLSPPRTAWTPISSAGRSPTSPSRPWTKCAALHLLDDLGEVHRRAARRVLLEAVVPLDDLHVEALALERLGRQPRQLEQQVDDEAHVRREQHGRLVGRGLDLGLLRRGVPGRRDDERDLPRDADRQDRHRARRARRSRSRSRACATAAGRSVIGTPMCADARRARPRRGPAPGWSGASTAATTCSAWSSLASATSRWPIRPQAPLIAM